MLLGYTVRGWCIHGAVGGGSFTLFGMAMAWVSLSMLEALLPTLESSGLIGLANEIWSGCGSGIERGGADVGGWISLAAGVDTGYIGLSSQNIGSGPEETGAAISRSL
jgi:hypothetical protein